MPTKIQEYTVKPVQLGPDQKSTIKQAKARQDNYENVNTPEIDCRNKLQHVIILLLDIPIMISISWPGMVYPVPFDSV